MKRKLISFILTVMMVMCLFPVTALAADENLVDNWGDFVLAFNYIKGIGGTISGTAGIEVTSGGTVYVSGGEVTGSYWGIYANGKSLVNVSGGEVKSTHTTGGAGVVLTAGSTANISGDAIVTGEQ
ncbi:hypothetical protein HZF24_04730 [Sedimentibacter hydroxybenzoicus DSM 7310]|uniref:Uncharacterized protein n=1 Tax=Sedimentibacter hydroxybenzoicus DSM 7310 TaxID=1123245 RepID=A0A974BHT5_SEDHY|nr:hypothetical protein [Sedimentibacter hydroxybenzoicus]NYB73439.1 hypothetical protein [Sedimentibacter hydroxybenzoicus DSM 7310]